MGSLSSEELNYLIFRYLNESGLQHSAFNFGYEAGVNKSTIDPNKVPPGALVKFVQKGLQFVEMEASLTDDEDNGDEEDLALLEPLDLITKDVSELRKIVKEKRKGKKVADGGKELVKTEQGGASGKVKVQVKTGQSDKQEQGGASGNVKVKVKTGQSDKQEQGGASGKLKLKLKTNRDKQDRKGSKRPHEDQNKKGKANK